MHQEKSYIFYKVTAMNENLMYVQKKLYWKSLKIILRQKEQNDYFKSNHYTHSHTLLNDLQPLIQMNGG